MINNKRHHIDEKIKLLLKYFNNGNNGEAEKLAVSLTDEFPDNQFAWKILGALWWKKNKNFDALNAMQTAIRLSPNDASAYYNLGIALKESDRLKESEEAYRKALELKYDYPEANNNLGVVLQGMGRTNEAINSFKRELEYNPTYAGAFWNLSGCEKNIKDAEHWINKCLEVDANHIKAKLTKAALSYYQGKRDSFMNLAETEFRNHSFMRSFSWVFNLPQLPEIHFNIWYFFDSIIKKSINKRPFYEFGVWRGSSFKYLIKTFKKGYGFDTFTGLPEDWSVGNNLEKAGTYSSDGNIPKIDGGIFIQGNFENTLPVFFSEKRPKASIINFDADLYSSTICALNYSKQVMDKDTILVFDEFLMNDSWEQDEFKALNEFCSHNSYSYEVLAVSFFTKQVAVKLLGI
tara:strand:+ start:103 stop:1317 length:1215 start_codon:yes stop_codon:yes gene_type:complete